MKMKLLIATSDISYTDHLSGYLSARFADAFEVSTVSQRKRFDDLLEAGRFDVALLDYDFAKDAPLSSIRLPLLLAEDGVAQADSELVKIQKYQRISSMVSNILQAFADLGLSVGSVGKGARIVAVWSPTGGVGKTSVALAYAANRANAGRQALYLNMENFASTPAYFKQADTSISKVFEKLDTKDANIQILLTGLRQQDSDSGIYYFGIPENYEDINILTEENLQTMIAACAEESDDLVIDLSGQYSPNVMNIFEMAQFIMIVSDASDTSQAKLHQFINQYNVFEQIRPKVIQVNNKGARNTEAVSDTVINLPAVSTADGVTVFKTLAGNNFNF